SDGIGNLDGTPVSSNGGGGGGGGSNQNGDWLNMGAPVNDSSSYLVYFNSQPGDWVGAGQVGYSPTTDGTFTATKQYDNGVRVSFNGPGATWWDLEFSSADNTPLVAGTEYDNAERNAFKSAGHPGIDVGGSGRGCNTIGGRFKVLEVEYGTGT